MGYGNGDETITNKCKERPQKQSTTMEEAKQTIYEVYKDTSPSKQVSYH